jgi:hypothetical protein
MIATHIKFFCTSLQGKLYKIIGSDEKRADAENLLGEAEQKMNNEKQLNEMATEDR